MTSQPGQHRVSDPTADSMGDGLHVGAVVVGRAFNLADPTPQLVCLELFEDDEGHHRHHAAPYILDHYAAGVIATALALQTHAAGPQAVEEFRQGSHSALAIGLQPGEGLS